MHNTTAHNSSMNMDCDSIKPNKSLLKETLKYALLTKKYLYIYSIIIIINAIVGILKTYFLSRLVNDTKMINIYIGCYVMNYCVNAVLCYYSEKMMTCIKTMFKNDYYKLYDKLCYNDKQKIPIYTFRDNINDATTAISSMVNLVTKYETDMIVSIISCTLIFYYQQLLSYIVLIVVLVGLFYLFVIRKLQVQQRKIRTASITVRNKSRELTTLWLPSLQYNEFDVNKIIYEYNKIINENSKVSMSYRKISQLLEVPGILCIILAGHISTTSIQYMLLMHIINQFNNIVSSFSYIRNEYTKTFDEYITFYEYWFDKKISPPPEKLQLPLQIAIINIDVHRGNFTLSTNINKIVISKGDKILINGRSASGKTTFIEALIGHIEGIKFEFFEPFNFTHNYIYCRQNIRETLPTSEVSLSDLFSNDYNNDENIIKSLEICELSELIEQIGGLDKPIKNALSGGQKQRLAIALNINKTFQHDTLIIDEPEQGNDLEIAILMLQNIFKIFSHKTIIIVSHLPPNYLTENNIQFNQHFTIKNGIVN